MRTVSTHVILFKLLALLQALVLFWLCCLLLNAFRRIFMGITKHDRSLNEKGQPEPELDSAVANDKEAAGEEQRDVGAYSPVSAASH